MIKAKEVTLRNIVVFLVFSLAISAGYFLVKPRDFAGRNELVFAGEEVVVNKSVKALTAVEVERVVRVGQAEKAITAPAPKVAAPLPIVPPAVTFKVLPQYPLSAIQKEMEGAVLLSVYVGLNGRPEKIETKTSSGNAEFDSSAMKAVSQWRFSPAAQGGQALASWFEVPVRFVLN